MAITSKTAIVTGGSQGIGSGAVRAFLDRDYNAVATSRNVSKSKELPSSAKLALVDGDIGEAATAARVAGNRFQQIRLDRCLGRQRGDPLHQAFTDYTAEDFKRLVSQSRRLHLHDPARDQADARAKLGKDDVSITASLADNPIAGVNASIPMITKAVSTRLHAASPSNMRKTVSV